MKTYSIFIDGAAGTTGLRLRERLAARPELRLVTLEGEARKSLAARVDAARNADLTVLCLPDEASREMAAALPREVRLVDASSAHRTLLGWQYGFPELGRRRRSIAAAARVSVPGCHATGFLALAAPLVEEGLLPPDASLACHSLTGYSGGGRAMIEAYEAPDRPNAYEAPRLYGLGLAHKHLPEMVSVAGLAAAPLFCPVVDDYYSGMLVSLPLAAARLPVAHGSPEALLAFYQGYYQDEALVQVHAQAPADGTLPANLYSGRDSLHIYICGNTEQLLLLAAFDNLGKGASGAAVQCLNLMLGLPETTGLVA